MSDINNEEEDVGYGKPPVGLRWKKGQSGNPRGRKKGAKGSKNIFKNFMEERLPGSQQLTTREAILMTLRHAALVEKSPRAIKMLLDMDAKYSPEIYKYGSAEAMSDKIRQLEEELEKQKTRQQGGVLVVPATADLDEFIKEAEVQRQIMLKHQAQQAEIEMPPTSAHQTKQLL